MTRKNRVTSSGFGSLPILKKGKEKRGEREIKNRDKNNEKETTNDKNRDKKVGIHVEREDRWERKVEVNTLFAL